MALRPLHSQCGARHNRHCIPRSDRILDRQWLDTRPPPPRPYPRGPGGSNVYYAWLRTVSATGVAPLARGTNPPETQRSARSDGRFRGDSQSPGIGPRDARHHDGTHAGPVRPSFINEGMASEVAASRAPSASVSSISAAGDEQADLGVARLGFRAAELQQLCGAPAAFFLCARAGGVWRGVWRGVACGVAWRGVFLAPKPPWA